MYGKLLCKIGVHDQAFSERFLPSREAPIVEEYRFDSWCKRCDKTLLHIHWTWDAEKGEMRDIE